MDSSPLRVLVADDHGVMRGALRAILEAEPDMAVVGEAANGAEALRLAQRLSPDVALMDIGMPVMDGLEATRQIASSLPDTAVLILTMYAEDAYLLDVLEAGGSGYLLKRCSAAELIEAVRAVSRGEAFLYPSGARMLLQAFLRRQGEDARCERRTSFSDREEQVLTLTAEGFTNQEIAERLYLSTKTVDTYRQRIMEKLGLHHRSALVHYALAHGLLKSSRSGSGPV